MRLLLLALLGPAGLATSSSFSGYKVYRTGVLDAATTALLDDLQSETPGLDFWKEPAPGRRADIMAPPHLQEQLLDFLGKHGVSYEVMIHDVQRWVY